MNKIYVYKSDGSKELYDIEKINKVLKWATENLTGVSISDIEMKMGFDIIDGVTTDQIHESLIRACAELISEEQPNYQYVAARLGIIKLRKMVYGSHIPDTIFEHVTAMTEDGRYTPEILETYTEEDFKTLERIINHDKDYKLAFVAVNEFMSKYLVQNRLTKEMLESPQMCYMIQAMTNYIGINDPDERLEHVIDDYIQVSDGKVSYPTPIMAGLRTNIKQFASCFLIEMGDDVDSISATGSAINKYIARKAGVGVNMSNIRAEGALIRGGEAYHTGITPLARKVQSDIKSFSQGGVRGGAGTVYFPIWHLEIETILNLKNEKGTEDNRVRRVDYGINFNTFIYKRLLQKGHISLFSPNEVKDLHDAFYADQEEFERLYEHYESICNTLHQYKRVEATELFNHFVTERAETGRYYYVNIDTANIYGRFKPDLAPVKQSNLCLEILLPTKPILHDLDKDGWIALCTLAAINMGEVKQLSDLESICRRLVVKLDTLLDYQDYKVPAAKTHTDLFRPLGVGVINYAHWMAKNGLTFDNTKDNYQESLDRTHEFFEAMSFYLIKASIELAKERGKCEGYSMTKWSDGIFPVDLYKKDVDNLTSTPLLCDWDSLRADLYKYGIRNSTLMAIMPAETSAKISNSTNGIEPVRSLITLKGGKESLTKQVVPDIRRLKNKYDLLWNLPSPKGYLGLVAVMQKFVCQAISANTSYNPAQEQYAQYGGKIPSSVMLSDQLFGVKHGIRTVYYNNLYDNNEVDTDEAPEEDCDSCKI